MLKYFFGSPVEDVVIDEDDVLADVLGTILLYLSDGT